MDEKTEQIYTVGMEAAKTIYKILTAFERQLDVLVFDMDEISPDVLGVSKLRRDRYLQMLIEAGYISGLTVKELSDHTFRVIETSPKITLKGIEYLAENSTMQKVVGFIKKGAEITIPALI